MDDDRTVPRRGVLHFGSAALFGTAGLSNGTKIGAQARTGQEDDSSTREVTLGAESGRVDVGADERYETWLYDGEFPGPELRVREGETLRVSLENQLSEETTVHWHGVPVPNSMDGVPDVTQAPVSPGGTFEYEYEAAPAGTYVYHSHVGLQLDRGLYGPLIVEEESPHVEYDREYALLVDDYLPGDPALDSIEAPPGGGTGPGNGPGGDGGMGPGGDGGPGPDGDGGMGPGGGGSGGPGSGGNGRGQGPDGGGGPGGGGGMGPDGNDGRGGGSGPGGERGPGNGPNGDGERGPGGQMRRRRPPYEGLLVNGRLPSDPPVFEVREGDRVRLRFINPSSATTYRVGVGGHSLTVTHADGRPVEPVTVDSLVMSMGERYDAIVEADSPGEWAIVAEPVVGSEDPAEARLRYRDAAADGSPDRPQFDGRELGYGDLVALDPLDVDGDPDRTFDLTLSGGMMGGSDAEAWTIDGQVYPDADPFEISEGEHVRVRMVNRSPVIHPMHLHGHFFQVGDAVKDTVLVAPHGDRVTFDFRADNPGDWLFHCHNVYHLERGMARVFEYE